MLHLTLLMLNLDESKLNKTKDLMTKLEPKIHEDFLK